MCDSLFIAPSLAGARYIFLQQALEEINRREEIDSRVVLFSFFLNNKIYYLYNELKLTHTEHSKVNRSRHRLIE